mgnify:CR=1 FL=1
MRIIIDECVPSIVKRGLPERKMVSVQDAGWAGIKNGELLRLVSADFDVFITFFYLRFTRYIHENAPVARGLFY